MSRRFSRLVIGLIVLAGLVMGSVAGGQAAQISSVTIKPNGYDFRSGEMVDVLVCFNITGQFSTSLLGNTLWKAGVNTGRFDYKVDLYRAAYGGFSKKLVKSMPYTVQAGRSTREGDVKHGCRRFRFRAGTLGKGKTKLRAYVKLYYKSGGELTGHNLSGQSRAVYLFVDSKTAYGQGSPSAAASQPKTTSPPKPRYKWVTTTEKVKVPYTAYERVAVKKQVKVKKAVKKVKTVNKTCYREEKVKHRVPVTKWVQEKTKVRKTRMVEKKVRKKVKVTKYRQVPKRVAKKVTKEVEKTVGTKTVQEKYQTTIMTTVDLPYYEQVTEMVPTKVTKTRRVKKTRKVTKHKVEKYPCNKKVTKRRKEKVSEWRWVNEPVKKTIREAYQAKEKVYVNQQVRQAYWTTVTKTVYRNVRRPVRKTTYVTRYRYVRRNGRRVKVPYRQRVTRTVYVNKRVPHQVRERVKKFRTVTKRVPRMKTVTKYRPKVVTEVKRVKKKITRTVDKPYQVTVKSTCERKVPYQTTETYWTTEKYTETVNKKVTRQVKKTRKSKKPKIVWKTRNKTVPIKKKVKVTETVWVTEKVREPYDDWEFKTTVARVREPYDDWEIKRVKKTVYEDKYETKRVSYNCPEKVPYTDYVWVTETKTVYEKKPVKKFRWETKQVRKKVKVN